MAIVLKQLQDKHADLTPSQPYGVIGLEADDYRLLNDRSQPYLYPAEQFEVLDNTEPADWITERGEDGERYAYPAPLNVAGFFEDFFDRKLGAMRIFWQVVNQRLALAAA